MKMKDTNNLITMKPAIIKTHAKNVEDLVNKMYETFI